METYEQHKEHELIADGLDLYELHQNQLSTKSQGFYNYIKSITPNEVVIYIAVIIVIVILIHRLSPSYLHVIGIVCGIIVIYFIISMRDTTKHDYNTIEEMKLLSPQLRDTKYFYIDTDLIDLFYDLGEYQKYSNKKFKQIITHVDNFLHLQTDIEKGAIYKKYVYEQMDQLKATILNDFHSMIYDLPQQNEILDKYNKATTKLHLLLNQHLNVVRVTIKKLDGSIPIDMYPMNYPIANDKLANPHYDVY